MKSMMERNPATPDLDTRLAEFDRKLREIQSDLDPARTPPPVRPPTPQAAEAPAAAPRPAAQHEPPRDPEPPPAPEPPRDPQPEAHHQPPGGRQPPGHSEPPADREPPEPPPPPRYDPPPPAAPPPSPSEPHRGRAGPLADLLAQHAPSHPPAEVGLEEFSSALVALRQAMSDLEAVLERMSASGHEATIAAGPFASIQEVRAFERELAAVRGVRDVTVRGYEGAARAIIDVRFAED